ncbi:Nucleolar protein [Entamoeba marina]
MKATQSGGVKVYNLTAELLKDEDFQKRIELIQDTKFPVNTQRVLFSPDGIVYELDQLSMKFERHLDAEIQEMMVFLEDDYTKVGFLLSDKTVEFHNKGGIQCKIKIPKIGRDFKYLSSNCNTYIATSENLDILNLYEGKFYESIPISNPTNCLALSDKYQLIFCGCDNGVVSVVDPISNQQVNTLNVNENIINKYDASGNTLSSVDVTSIAYDNNLQITVGTSNGNVLTYDIRSSKPILSNYHQNRLPIIKTMYHTTQNGEFIVTTDANIVKFNNKLDGKLIAPLESSRRSVISDVAIAKDSGLLLGISPKWCSFLENITDELEDEPSAIYEDFHFVTKQELIKLGMQSFIGSEYLRPYMHGFFMHIKLYQRVMSLQNVC